MLGSQNLQKLMMENQSCAKNTIVVKKLAWNLKELGPHKLFQKYYFDVRCITL